MKEIQLSEEDIKELENIINCLQSKDKETFQLGKSLFETKFPVNLFIPIADIFIPLQPYWDNLYFQTFELITADIKPYKAYDYTMTSVLLGNLIKSKYYAISENN